MHVDKGQFHLSVAMLNSVKEGFAKNTACLSWHHIIPELIDIHEVLKFILNQI